jgi:hypothetical protein
MEQITSLPISIQLKKYFVACYKNIWLVSLGMYSLWILIGVIYYKFVENWTYATAYFYTIEAGLSIGFCDPAERTDASRLFTVVHVLLGSSVVVGSLGGLGNELIGDKKVPSSLLCLSLSPFARLESLKDNIISSSTSVTPPAPSASSLSSGTTSRCLLVGISSAGR